MTKLLKNYRHLIVAILVFIAFKMLIAPINGLTPGGVSVLGIFVATVYLWITVGVDWTSFLSIAALCCITDALTATQVFASSFGSFMVPLMIAIMIMNDCLEKAGITKKLATWFITRKIVKNRPWVFIAMFLFAGMVLEMFMELIPPMIIMMAMAESISKDLGYEKGDKFPKALMIGILWTSVVMFGASPIAHSTIVMLIGIIEETTGASISFLQYMSIGIPFALLFYLVTLLVLRFVVRPDVSKFVNYNIEEKKKDIQPLTRQAKATLGIFVIVVVLWVMPDFGSYLELTRPFAAFLKGLGPAFPPIIGVILMSVVRVEDKPLLKLGDSLKNVSWPAIIFSACIMLLSSCISMESTGITAYITSLFAPLGNALSPMMLVAVACLAALIMTNFMSCTLSAILTFTGFAPILMSGGDVNMALVVSMGIGICLMADTAFLTPPANPGAPLIYGSGYLPVADGLKYGWIMMLAGYIILIAVIAPWSRFLLGA